MIYCMHTEDRKSSNANYRHLMPYEVIFNGLLTLNPDGSIAIAETRKDIFHLLRGRQRFWEMIVLEGFEAFFPVFEPQEIFFAEIDSAKLSLEDIALLKLLRSLQSLTGQSYSNITALRVAMALTLPQHMLKILARKMIDDRSSPIYFYAEVLRMQVLRI